MHLKPIFEDHPTARFISKVKGVHFLSCDIAIFRATAGMVPPQQSDINPNANTHHSLVVVRVDGKWRIKPARFHGRPELVEQMTEELRELLK